jgi:hypothetical protein
LAALEDSDEPRIHALVSKLNALASPLEVSGDRDASEAVGRREPDDESFPTPRRFGSREFDGRSPSERGTTVSKADSGARHAHLASPLVEACRILKVVHCHGTRPRQRRVGIARGVRREGRAYERLGRR